MDDVIKRAVEAAVIAILRNDYSCAPEDLPDEAARVARRAAIAIAAALPVIVPDLLQRVLRSSRLTDGSVSYKAAEFYRERLLAEIIDELGRTALAQESKP